MNLFSCLIRKNPDRKRKTKPLLLSHQPSAALQNVSVFSKETRFSTNTGSEQANSFVKFWEQVGEHVYVWSSFKSALPDTVRNVVGLIIDELFSPQVARRDLI